MSSKWKGMFFLLLALNIFFVFFILFLIMKPINEQEQSLPNRHAEKELEEVGFEIRTNKQDLNTIMNHYLDKNASKDSIHYEVILQDEVELYGTIRVFTQDIEMKLTFEPEALPNGDLILNHRSISIGKLNLPVPYVLKFISERYNLPEWVHIQPNDELVYVSFQKMSLNNNMMVRVNKFNLKEDDIMFTLMIPTE